MLIEDFHDSKHALPSPNTTSRPTSMVGKAECVGVCMCLDINNNIQLTGIVCSTGILFKRVSTGCQAVFTYSGKLDGIEFTFKCVSVSHLLLGDEPLVRVFAGGL